MRRLIACITILTAGLTWSRPVLSQPPGQVTTCEMVARMARSKSAQKGYLEWIQDNGTKLEVGAIACLEEKRMDPDFIHALRPLELKEQDLPTPTASTAASLGTGGSITAATAGVSRRAVVVEQIDLETIPRQGVELSLSGVACVQTWRSLYAHPVPCTQRDLDGIGVAVTLMERLDTMEARRVKRTHKRAKDQAYGTLQAEKRVEDDQIHLSITAADIATATGFTRGMLGERAIQIRLTGTYLSPTPRPQPRFNGKIPSNKAIAASRAADLEAEEQDTISPREQRPHRTSPHMLIWSADRTHGQYGAPASLERYRAWLATPPAWVQDSTPTESPFEGTVLHGAVDENGVSLPNLPGGVLCADFDKLRTAAQLPLPFPEVSLKRSEAPVTPPITIDGSANFVYSVRLTTSALTQWSVSNGPWGGVKTGSEAPPPSIAALMADNTCGPAFPPHTGFYMMDSRLNLDASQRASWEATLRSGKTSQERRAKKLRSLVKSGKGSDHLPREVYLESGPYVEAWNQCVERVAGSFIVPIPEAPSGATCREMGQWSAGLLLSPDLPLGVHTVPITVFFPTYPDDWFSYDDVDSPTFLIEEAETTRLF